jgi:hypothetical protein
MGTDFRANPKALTQEYAKELDAQDVLRNLQDEFIIPTRGDLKRKRLVKGNSDSPF